MGYVMDEAARHRFKLLQIDERTLLQVLEASQLVPDPATRGWLWAVPMFKGLPDGYCVSGVVYSFERQAFLVRVHHPSFAQVEPGWAPEVEDAVIKQKVLRFQAPDE